VSALIAIVDDEPDIVELISLNLERAGFRVKSFYDARSFYEGIASQSPDLVVLDLMLPDEDGIEVCKRLRRDKKFSEIPIVILSARADELDKVVGLEIGADDYVTKPFSPNELVARVKAVLRRNSKRGESDIIRIGDFLAIDTKKYEVVIGGKKVDLTATEFKIISLLASQSGIVFSRDQILDYLWGTEKAVIDRTIDVHMKNLRKKMGTASSYIKNVRGIGYKLEV